MKITKQQMLDAAEILDAYRVFPRVFLFAYGALCWHMVEWAMTLKDLSTQQAGFVSAIVGLAVPLTGWYMSTGRKWQ